MLFRGILKNYTADLISRTKFKKIIGMKEKFAQNMEVAVSLTKFLLQTQGAFIKWITRIETCSKKKIMSKLWITSYAFKRVNLTWLWADIQFRLKWHIDNLSWAVRVRPEFTSTSPLNNTNRLCNQKNCLAKTYHKKK